MNIFRGDQRGEPGFSQWWWDNWRPYSAWSHAACFVRDGTTWYPGMRLAMVSCSLN